MTHVNNAVGGELPVSGYRCLEETAAMLLPKRDYHARQEQVRMRWHVTQLVKDL